MNSTLQTPAGNSLSGPLSGKHASRLSGLLLVVMGSVLLIMLFSLWSYKGRFWEDWYPLLISSSYTSEELELFLSEMTDGEMISESNSLLRYNGFGESESISVSELISKNAPYADDPRLDPYMTGSLSYFNQGQYKIYYLPANFSALVYDHKLRSSSLLSGSEWMLADGSFQIGPAVLFAGIIFFLCIGCFRFCVPAVGFLFLGFFAFSSGDNHLLIIMVLAAMPVRYMMERSNPFFLGLFLLPIVWGLVSSILDFRYAAALAALGCISLGVSLFLPSVKRSRSGRNRRAAGRKAGYDHALFEPVPLTGPVTVKHRKGESRAVIVLISVFSLLLLFISGHGERLLPAGIPAVEASDLSWDFESLSSMDDSSEFPGVCAYYRHRAYQDSFMYGGDYSLPLPGSTLRVDDFVLEDGTIINRPRIAFSFDGEWFHSTLAEMTGSGPGRLMGSEEFIPRIVRKNSYVFGNSIGILLMAGLCLLFIFYIRIFGMHPDRRVRSDRFSGKFVFRRKQQAA